MRAMPDDFREAYEEITETLHRIAGLSHGLHDLALAHPVVGGSEPESEAIVSLIVVVREKAAVALKQLDPLWTAAGGKA